MRPKFLAFGILIVYAVTSLYLERIIELSNPLFKTVLSFSYFLIWISPLVYFWRKAKLTENVVAPILVICLAILYISPLTIIPVPIGKNLPDVDFHAAKILYCSTGHFFNDPVTSYPSIYPPVYHIIIGSIMRVLGSNDSWFVLSWFHIVMLVILFLSVYFLANFLFDPRIGLLSALFLGAIFDMPNQGPMFISTPFHLGLTVMVNSVTLAYWGLQGKRWCFYFAGIVTGLAVTIWPAFLPVAIVLGLVIFFTAEKKFRKGDLLKFILTFLIFPLMVWVPQYLLLSEHHLMGTTIGQFEGVPGPSWLFDFVSRFILLGGFDWHLYWVTVLFGITYAIFLGIAILGFRSLGKPDLMKKRFLRLFFILMFLVLPIVHYIFYFTYSRRVQILFSILIIIVAAYYVVAQLAKKRRLLVAVFVTWVAVFTCGWNIYTAHSFVLGTKDRYETWKKDATPALQFIRSNTAFGEYIFATKKTYRFVILGNLIRFNLLAHRSGTYYSLNPDLSEKMLNQYNTVLGSNDFDLIMGILNSYSIRYVLINEGDQVSFPGLGKLYENCPVAYRDENYLVLRCDALPK